MARNWGSFWAGSAMVAVAVTLFLAFASASANLESSCDLTYQRLKFMDLCLNLRGAGARQVERVASIHGVAAAEGRRVVTGANLLLEGGDVSRGIFIGLPVGSRPRVNDVFVERGRYLARERGEALVERRFADLHGIGLGDAVTARLESSGRLRYTVVGLVSSPEYLWLADDRLDPRPSARRLGVVFLSQADVCTLAGREGNNEICVRLNHPRDLDPVLREAEKRLGGELSGPTLKRSDQPSNALLVRDRRAFQAIAAIFPSVFLALAGMTIWGSLKQLVGNQRKQIGVLMAQGLAEGQIFLHYIFTSLSVAGAGTLLGGVAGYWLGLVSTGNYVQSLGLPFVVSSLPARELGLGVLAVAAVAIASAWQSAGRLIQMEPAEVLRAEFATGHRNFGLRRWSILGRIPPLLRLPIRNLLRQPVRSLTVMCGIAVANAVLIMSQAFFDGQREMTDFLFHHVYRHDLLVNLRQPTSPAALPPIQSWPGVLRAEFYLRHGAYLGTPGGPRRELAVWGLPAGSQLLRLFDVNRREIAIPLPGSSREDTIYLDPVRQRDLRLPSGSQAEFRPSYHLHPGTAHPMTVGPDLFEPVVEPPRLSLHRLRELVGSTNWIPHDAVNIIFLKVDPEYLGSVRSRLYSIPNVGSVEDFRQMKEDVANLMRMVNSYFTVIFLFSFAMALALIAGATTMNIFERKREIATMIILGVRERQLVMMVAGEVVLLWAAGLVVGVPLGFLLGEWLLNLYQSDLIQISVHPRLATVLAAILSSLALALLASANAVYLTAKVPLHEACQGAE